MFFINDLFCGAGGMALGFQLAGFQIAGAWDIDKYAIQSYQANLLERATQFDISEMTWKNIPYADIWTLGFPCQDISIAKKHRAGLFGERSRMFFEVMRLLKETREYHPDFLPKAILAENVKHISSYQEIIEQSYHACGYKMYSVLYDSQYWGVPQHRERYFFLGIREDIKIPFFFPQQPTKVTTKLKDVLEEEVSDKYYIHKPYFLFPKQKGNVIGLVQIKGQDSIKRIYDINGIAPTLTTSQGGYRQPKIIDQKGLRRLTPREYARLQGFPEWYKQVVSDTQFYKLMGNAVTVPVAKAIALSLKEWLLQTSSVDSSS